MKRVTLKNLLALIFITLLLTSCGGGGSTIAGIGGTGITTSGTITGFGSIFVNGVEYDLTGAGITVDGVPASDADLTLGMVVKIEGTIDGNGLTGTANSVSYNAELQGPISSAITADADNITKSFNVLGRTVVVTVSDTTFENVSFATLATNDAVEISGYLDQNGILQATRIKKITSTLVIFSGIVSNYNNMSQFEIVHGSATISVSYGGSVPISNGDNVRIEGMLQTMMPTISVIASDVQAKQAVFASDEDNASLEGIITDYVSNSNFKIDGQIVDASSASFSPSTLGLTNGLRVEAEGVVVSGTMVATSIERRGGNIKIFTTVDSTNVPSNIVSMAFPDLQALPVMIDATTSMKDEDQELRPFTISDINSSDYLEINAYLNNGNLVASSIVRKKANEYEEQILRAPLTGVDTGMMTVEIQGIHFAYDPSRTSFENNDSEVQGAANISNFLSDLPSHIGDIIQVKDMQPLDGIVDEVDLKN